MTANEADTEATTDDTDKLYPGDWPRDPINGDDPVYGLEQEAIALGNLAQAVFHIGAGDGGHVDSGAVAHIGDAVERHARRLEHFVGQLRRRERAALESRILPAPENPLHLRLLRDRLLRAAGEVTEALGEAPAPGAAS